MKRKALSVLSCLALIASSLPSTAVFVSAAEKTVTEPGTPQYVTIVGTDGAGVPKTKHAVFANGTDIEVTYDDKTQTNTVTYTKTKPDGKTVEGELPSIPTDADVFAGCHGSSQAVGSDEDPVEIVINGAKLNTVYGGGLHESTVNNVKITVKGKAELNWVCGGGANCLIKDECAQGSVSWQSGQSENSKTFVKNAEITIEDAKLANCVYGGGEGFSKTENTTVNIKDGTILAVCASGSNGYTSNSNVNIEGGTITEVRSVTRGTIASSDVAVSGGTINNLYIGGSDNCAGTVNNSNVDITSGTVKELHAGKSNSQPLDVSQQNYSFSADPSSVEAYNADIQQQKDKENAYYYFKAYKADGQEATGSELAKKLTSIVQIMTGSNKKTYQAVFVMANGVTVTATDVKDESGKWKATKIACTGEGSDGSYVETNYDLVHLFGGSHNSDEKVESTDVTLDGTTHVQTVWGGGWHESQTGTTKVTVKGNAEVKGIQGGAANFFAGTNCGTPGCEGYNGSNSSKKCFDKPVGKEASDYNVSPNARVEKAEVIVESCKPYTTPSKVTCQTLIYGGGEALAYTGECTVTIKGGEFNEDAWVIPAGSNGYTGKSSLVVDGEVEIPNVGSGKSGIVKEADIEVKNGTVKKLTVGMIDSPQGYGELEASDVTVSGGTVTDVVFGYKDASQEINPDSDEGYTVTADGGNIDKVGGQPIDYSKQDLVCEHDKYAKEEVEAGKGTPATCQAAGTYDYWKCSNCKRYIIVKDGEYEDVTNEQGDGVDETKLVMQSGPTHHVYDGDIVVTVDATCLTDGMKSYTVCTACGKQKAIVTDENGEYIKEVAADKSKYQYTDTKDGVATKITDEDLVIKALGHSPKTVPAIESTCTSEGRTAWVMCDRDGCGVTIVAPTTTPKKDHTYGQEIAEKKATCKDPGTKAHYQCSVCKNLFVKDGDVYTQVTEDQLVIPATNEHTWGEYTANNDATCTTPGTKTAECSVCGAKDTQEDTDNPAKGHSYLENLKEEVPATCTEDGVKAHYECTVCGAKFVEKITEQEAPAEPLKEYVEVTEENYDELLKIPALGHNEVKLEAVAATCTATGLTEGLKCDRCGEVLVPQTVVPTIPHKNDVKLEAVKETCETWGLTEGVKCSVCGTITTPQTLIPPLGHDYDANGVCKRDGAIKPGVVQPTQPTNVTQAPTTAGPKVSVKVLKITQAKLTKLKVKSKAKNKINVSWKKVANAKGYQIEVSKSSSFKSGAKVLTKSTKNLKLTIKNKKLKSGKTYYVRARAYTTYKAADGSTKKAYSNWNYVLRKVKVK